MNSDQKAGDKGHPEEGRIEKDREGLLFKVRRWNGKDQRKEKGEKDDAGFWRQSGGRKDIPLMFSLRAIKA